MDHQLTYFVVSKIVVSKNKIKTRKTLVLHACSIKLLCSGPLQCRRADLAAQAIFGEMATGRISPQMWSSGSEPCILWATQWHSACPILWDTSTPASSSLQTPSNFLPMPAVRRTELFAVAKKLQKVFVLPTGHDLGTTQQHQGLNGQSTGLRFKCAVEAVLVGREPCVRETWSPSEHHQAPHKALLPLLLPPNLRSRLN